MITTKIYNLITWAVTFAAVIMALYPDGMFFHCTMVLLGACIIRFMGGDRVTNVCVAVCACGVMFFATVFLIDDFGDVVHNAVIIIATLLHAVPMFRFVVSGHKKVLYSGL